MTAALIVPVFLALFCQGSRPPSTTLQTEQATNPASVTDNLPDFRAVNPFSPQSAVAWRIRVTTFNDNPFNSPIWISPVSPAGLPFPGGAVPSGQMSSEIPYGTGTANLNSLALLDWGATYRWQIAMGRNTNNNNNWTGWSVTNFFTMALPTSTVSQQPNNGSPSGPSWRFLSVPIQFGTSVPASELLGVVPLLYRLDEPSRTWVQLGSGDVLEGGRGYLGWCTPSTVLNLTQGKVTCGIPATLNGSGATTTPSYLFPDAVNFPTYTFTRTLNGVQTGQEIIDNVPADSYAGNHLFGNPFYAPISWKSSTSAPSAGAYGHISMTNISNAMYKWDGTQYLTYNGLTDTGSAGEWIDPFQAVGIWVLASNYTLSVNTPPPMTGGSQKSMPVAPASFAPAADPDHWHLMIEARSGAAIDTENAFGIDPLADDAWDARDSEEPGPGSATWVSVYFDHLHDWAKYPRKYTHDFRKTPTHAGDQVTWTFTVDGNTGLPATLTWPNLSSIPAGDWKFTLEDPATSALVDLSTASSYDTQPVNGPSTLMLHATRLKDSPTPASGDGGSGGGNCGLLGLEGLLLAGWMLARRRCRLN